MPSAAVPSVNCPAAGADSHQADERTPIMADHDAAGADPWEERLQFGQLFLRYLSTLGRPLLPGDPPPMDVAGCLEMIGLGEMIAKYDRAGAAKPGFYRDPAYLHGALDAGATWEQLAEALGVDEATARRRYREWADDQHRQWTGTHSQGLDDDEYAAAIKRTVS